MVLPTCVLRLYSRPLFPLPSSPLSFSLSLPPCLSRSLTWYYLLMWYQLELPVKRCTRITCKQLHFIRLLVAMDVVSTMCSKDPGHKCPMYVRIDVIELFVCIYGGGKFNDVIECLISSGIVELRIMHEILTVSS